MTFPLGRAVALALLQTALFAAPAPASEKLELRLAAADFQTEAGLAEACRKIIQLAERACEDDSLYPKPLPAPGAQRRCVKRQIDQIVSQIDDPRLTAYRQAGKCRRISG